jgi:hypothetical protein
MSKQVMSRAASDFRSPIRSNTFRALRFLASYRIRAEKPIARVLGYRVSLNTVTFNVYIQHNIVCPGIWFLVEFRHWGPLNSDLVKQIDNPTSPCLSFTVYDSSPTYSKKGLELRALTIQAQEISHLAEMINPPESFRLAIRISTYEPRKAKGSLLECPIRVGHQKTF